MVLPARARLEQWCLFQQF